MHTVEGRTKQPGKAIFTQRRKELLWIYFNALGAVKKKLRSPFNQSYVKMKSNQLSLTHLLSCLKALEDRWIFSGLIYTTA